MISDHEIDDAFDALHGREEESILRLLESPRRDPQGFLPPPLPAASEEMSTLQRKQTLSDPLLGSADRTMPAVDEGNSDDGSAWATGLSAFEALVAAAAGAQSEVLLSHADAPRTSNARNNVRSGPAWILYQPMRWDCIQCCLLREIVHFDDHCNMRLCVHGDVDNLHHGILVVHYFAEESKDVRFIAEFGQYDLRSVNLFLRDYIRTREEAGQRLVRDIKYTFSDIFSLPDEDEDLFPRLPPPQHPLPVINPRFPQTNVLGAAGALQLQPPLGFVDRRQCPLALLGFLMAGNPAPCPSTIPALAPAPDPQPRNSGQTGRSAFGDRLYRRR